MQGHSPKRRARLACAESARSSTRSTSHGEGQKALDVIANDIFVKATEWEGVLSGVASEEMDEPLGIPD